MSWIIVPPREAAGFRAQPTSSAATKGDTQVLNEALSVLVRNGEADTSASSAKTAKAAATYVKPRASAGNDAVVALREDIRAKLVYVLGKTPEAARERDWFAATALALRDRIVDACYGAQAGTVPDKRVYYLSL